MGRRGCITSTAPDFLALCVACLEQGVTIRFRAEGISMRPAIHPGDIVHVRPLSGTPPAVGEVVLLVDTQGKPRVHRIAARKLTGQELMTAGDGHLGELDAAIGNEQILGIVSAVERDGVPVPVKPLASTGWMKLQAFWYLYLDRLPGANAKPLRRVLGGSARRLRNGIGYMSVALRKQRRLPILGSLVEYCLPDLRERARLEVYVTQGRNKQDIYHFDAIWRERSIARLSLHQDFATLTDLSQWWISGIWTEPVYRGRGAASLIMQGALHKAAESGISEIFMSIAEDNIASQALACRSGFERFSDASMEETLAKHFSAIAPQSAPMLLYRYEVPKSSD